jgi:hypothetical protein
MPRKNLSLKTEAAAGQQRDRSTGVSPEYIPKLGPKFMNKLFGDEAEALLTAPQLAAELGCSLRFVKKLTNNRKIPYIRISSRFIRYRLEAVRRALQRFTVEEIKP